MLYGIYTVYDKIDKMIVHTGLAPSDASFIRRESVNLMSNYSLDDIEVYHVGYQDLGSCDITVCDKRLVDFSCYQINQDVRRNNLKKFGFSDEEIDARFQAEKQADMNNKE